MKYTRFVIDEDRSGQKHWINPHTKERFSEQDHEDGKSMPVRMPNLSEGKAPLEWRDLSEVGFDNINRVHRVPGVRIDKQYWVRLDMIEVGYGYSG